MEPVLLLCLIAGTLCTALWMARFRQRLGISKPAILIAAILHTIAGVFCVKLFAGLESFQLTLSGGMSLYGAISSCLSFMLLGQSVQARCEAGVRCDDPVCDLHAVDRARKLHCFRLLRRNVASWKQPAPLAHTGNRDGVPRCVVGIILPASLPASRSRNGVPIIYDGLWRFPVCGRVVPRGRRYFSRTAPCPSLVHLVHCDRVRCLF